MLNFFVYLPRRLAANIAGDWIDSEDVVRLDTAVCDTTTRPILAEILSAPDCVLHQNKQYKNTDSLVMWSTGRKVRVGTLLFNEESDVTVHEGYLTTYGESVYSVRSLVRTSKQTDANIKFMKLVALNCHQLEVLDLEGLMMNAGLNGCLLNCTKLYKLCISYPDNFDPQSLLNVQCPGLRTLSIVGSESANSTAVFLKICPNATSVSLRDCEHRISSAQSALQFLSPETRCLSLNNLAMSDTDLKVIVDRCPNITELKLKDIDFESENDDSLSTVGVEYMSNQLTHLSSVSLKHCNLSDECLQALLKPRANTLTLLSIVECNEVTVSGLNAALAVCTHLTHFHARLKWNHTGLDFLLLANVINLHLEMRNCENCRKFLARIAPNCKILQHLTVEITDRPDPTPDLHRIVRNCAEIRTMNIHAHEYEDEPLLSTEKLTE